MGSEDPILIALETSASKKEQLQKAFLELKSKKNAAAGFDLEWKELEEQFADADKNLRKSYEELVEKEQGLLEKCKKIEGELAEKERVVVEKEQLSLARLQKEKDAAIAAVLEEKLKWNKERQQLGGVAVPMDVAEANGIIALDLKTEIARGANGSLAEVGALVSSETVAEEDDKIQRTPKAEDTQRIEVKVRSHLKQLCEFMDGPGLRKYCVNHQNDIRALRYEMPSLLQFAIDPAKLVLFALEGCNLPEQNDTQSSGKAGQAALWDDCRACILLLEALASVLDDSISPPVISLELKASAKQIADKWKSDVDMSVDAADGNSLNAQAFLQLVATFGLASEYNEDDLCNLVLAIARRKRTPALCKALHLSSKIPGIVDKLAKEGKHVEALSFAKAFDILEHAQPVALLKAYLKDVRKTVQAMQKSGNVSVAVQNEAAAKELSALKSVVKCIEDYNLEPDYPSSPLRRRVVQLEKAKSDKKRSGGSVKGHSKRSRVSGAGYGAHTSSDRGPYRSSADDLSYKSGLANYSLGGQSAYDRRVRTAYDGPYAGVRTSASLSSSYLYPDTLGSSLYSPYGSQYNSYQYGNGLPPPPPAYQSSFMH